MKTLTKKLGAISLATAMFTGIGITQANATTTGSDTSNLEDNLSTEIIHQEAKKLAAEQSGIYVAFTLNEQQDNSGNTFYPMPSEAKDYLLVTPEAAKEFDIQEVGILNNEQKIKFFEKTIKTSKKIKEIKQEPSLRSHAFWAPGGGSYGPVSRGINVIGNGKVPYSWRTNVGTVHAAVGEVTGWRQGYNGSQFGKWETWYHAGVGSSGWASVHWENVLASKKFRAASTGILPVGGGFD